MQLIAAVTWIARFCYALPIEQGLKLILMRFNPLINFIGMLSLKELIVVCRKVACRYDTLLPAG